MSTPTPERPTMDDDLEQAYAQAHALAADERGPALAVRAGVLAAAREIAAQAAARAEPTPPLVPVAPPVADVGRGRAGAWNLSSWRVRSGAAFCAVLLVAFMAQRFDAGRKASDNVTVAAADQALSVQVVPAPAPPADLAPRSRMMAPVPVPVPIPEPTLVAQAPAVDAPVAAAPAPRERAEDATLDKPASRDPERAVAKADSLSRAAEARMAAREATAPVAAPAARATGTVVAASLRPSPTPLHVAANADDVDALARLLADPATRVDASDGLGRTALQYAVMAANVRAVRLLLAAGADPDHADASGSTPRAVARTGPNAEIAALLAAR